MNWIMINLNPDCVFAIEEIWNVKLKGTVNIISSCPPYKDGNARFTTIPFKALSVQEWIRINVYNFENLFKFGFLYNLRIFPAGKPFGIVITNSFKSIKTSKLSSCLISFKGTVVNRALPSLNGGSLKHYPCSIICPFHIVI